MKFNKLLILMIISILIILLFLSPTITGFFTKEVGSEIIDYRPKHCLNDKCIDSFVFSKLPPYPKDFSKEINSPESFWKQPEFYNFENGINYYINPPHNYLGYFGLGAYPSDRRIKLNAGGEVTTFTYFHTAWFVYTYQGVKLNVIMNENTKEYFEVTIEPDVILLEATFPLFEYNWTQKIFVKVKAKNPPKGKYLIGIDVSEPPLEYSQKWFEKYGGRYTRGGPISVGRPPYQIEVNI